MQSCLAKRISGNRAISRSGALPVKDRETALSITRLRCRSASRWDSTIEVSSIGESPGVAMTTFFPETIGAALGFLGNADGVPASSGCTNSPAGVTQSVSFFLEGVTAVPISVSLNDRDLRADVLFSFDRIESPRESVSLPLKIGDRPGV